MCDEIKEYDGKWGLSTQAFFKNWKKIVLIFRKHALIVAIYGLSF